MQSRVCLAALGVIRDAASNNISVYSIVDQLAAEAFPVFLQQIFVLGIWEREDGDPATINLGFRALNNQQQISAGNIEVIWGGQRRHRTIFALQGLVVREPGELRFEFSRDGAVLASYR